MDKYEEKKPVRQYDLENYKNEKDLTDTDKNVLKRFLNSMKAFDPECVKWNVEC